MTIFKIRDTIKDILEIRREPREDELGVDVLQWEEDPRVRENIQSSRRQRQERTEREDAAIRKLRIHLVLSSATVWIMFVVGGIECAFAALLQDEMKDDDEYHSSCTEYFVYQDLPFPGEEYPDVSGKCRLMLAWSYIMIVAGSFSLVRTLLQALPVHGPNHLTIDYEPDSAMDKWLTRSRAYGIRASFSSLAFILHLTSAIMLGVSPVITDKTPAAEEYHIMYSLCLGLVCASTVMTGHQTFATGTASWLLRESKIRDSRSTGYEMRQRRDEAEEAGEIGTAK